MVRITIDDSDHKGITTELEGMPEHYINKKDEQPGMEYMLTLTPAQQFGMLAMNVLNDNAERICSMLGHLHVEKLKAKAESN